MSKYANAGELKTPVFFKRVDYMVDPNTEVNVFGVNENGEDVPVWCKWVNAHGSDVWTALQMKLRNPATLTVRYHRLIDDARLILYRADDPKPYEVMSIDNVGQRDVWLEINVQRFAAAR